MFGYPGYPGGLQALGKDLATAKAQVEAREKAEAKAAQEKAAAEKAAEQPAPPAEIPTAPPAPAPTPPAPAPTPPALIPLPVTPPPPPPEYAGSPQHFADTFSHFTPAPTAVDLPEVQVQAPEYAGSPQHFADIFSHFAPAPPAIDLPEVHPTRPAPSEIPVIHMRAPAPVAAKGAPSARGTPSPIDLAALGPYGQLIGQLQAQQAGGDAVRRQIVQVQSRLYGLSTPLGRVGIDFELDTPQELSAVLTWMLEGQAT